MRRALGWFWKTGMLSTFLAGLFAVLPIVITVGIMAWVGGVLKAWLGPESFVGKALFQLGLQFVTDPTVASALGWVAVLLAIWLLGALLKSVGKKRIEKTFNAAVERIPLVNVLYRPVAQVVDLLQREADRHHAGHERRLLRLRTRGRWRVPGAARFRSGLPLQRPGVPDRLRADLAGGDVWSRRLRRSRLRSPSRYAGRRPDENMSLHRGHVLEGDPRPIRRPAGGGAA